MGVGVVGVDAAWMRMGFVAGYDGFSLYGHILPIAH